MPTFGQRSFLGRQKTDESRLETVLHRRPCFLIPHLPSIALADKDRGRQSSAHCGHPPIMARSGMKTPSTTRLPANPVRDSSLGAAGLMRIASSIHARR